MAVVLVPMDRGVHLLRNSMMLSVQVVTCIQLKCSPQHPEYLLTQGVWNLVGSRGSAVLPTSARLCLPPVADCYDRPWMPGCSSVELFGVIRSCSSRIDLTEQML